MLYTVARGLGLVDRHGTHMLASQLFKDVLECYQSVAVLYIGYGPNPRVRLLRAYMHRNVTNFFLSASTATVHCFQLYTLTLNTKCNYAFYGQRKQSNQIASADSE